jgi:uncharacterized phage infection (PIP) family protein YhgE
LLKLNRTLDKQEIDQNKDDITQLQSGTKNIKSEATENQNLIADFKNDLNDINNDFQYLKSANDPNKKGYS